MNRYDETNPHFVRPSQLPGDRHEGRHSHPHGHRHQHDRPDKHGPSPRSHHYPAPAPSSFLPHQDDQSHQPKQPRFVEPIQLHDHHADDPKPDTSREPHTQRQDQQSPRPHGLLVGPHHQDHFPGRHGRPGVEQGPLIKMPVPRKTNSLTWCAAVVCAIFGVVIILGGLVVLIVYLIFRPRIPRFDVSAATLNAAYLDMGYLLNADLTVLANFTNQNKKVSVDFSRMYVELYYGRTLISTQYIEPFSAPKAATNFENLHMVTSQVRLSELEIQRFKRQMMNNGVLFEVKGSFRARSNFGGLLRYSYWIHGRCTIMVTRPPDGVLAAKKCKSKH